MLKFIGNILDGKALQIMSLRFLASSETIYQKHRLTVQPLASEHVFGFCWSTQLRLVGPKSASLWRLVVFPVTMDENKLLFIVPKYFLGRDFLSVLMYVPCILMYVPCILMYVPCILMYVPCILMYVPCILYSCFQLLFFAFNRSPLLHSACCTNCGCICITFMLLYVFGICLMILLLSFSS